MTSSMPGCVFEYCGKVPEAIYKPEVFRSPLEQAVYNNDLDTFKQLVRVRRIQVNDLHIILSTVYISD